MQAVLRTLIALSVFGGALLFLCPAGGVRRVMGMLFTAVLVTAAVAPVHGFDYDLFSLGEAKFNSAEAEIMLSRAKSETLLKKLLLQKNSERWLEEQASKHGLKVSGVTVELAQDEWGNWLPYAASVRADGSPEEAERLVGQLRDELGIPPERQEWTLNE